MRYIYELNGRVGFKGIVFWRNLFCNREFYDVYVFYVQRMVLIMGILNPDVCL